MLQELSAGTLMYEDEIGASVTEVSGGSRTAATEATSTAHEEGVDGKEAPSYDLPLTRGSHSNVVIGQTCRS